MKIKSIILLACMFLSYSIGAKASDYEYPQHEISVGYGVIGMTDIASIFGEVFAGAFTGTVDELNTTGEISAQYLYNINKTWAVGCAAMYAGTKAYNKDHTCNQTSNFIALMPSVRATWFHAKHFGMYSRAAVGGLLDFSTTKNTGTNNSSDDSSTTGTYAFQVSPVAMEFGSNKVSGYLELGFGMQGMIMAGVRVGL